MNRRTMLLIGGLSAIALICVNRLSPLSSFATDPDQPAILAAALRDVAFGATPLIPCVKDQPALLDASTIRSEQAQVAARSQQTYAPDEPTHAALVTHLQDLISTLGAANGPGSQHTLCELSGGVNQVQVIDFTKAGTTARITIQFHIWNETVGADNGVPFHNKPESVIKQTDEAVNIDGHWLISRRGDQTFVSGAP